MAMVVSTRGRAAYAAALGCVIAMICALIADPLTNSVVYAVAPELAVSSALMGSPGVLDSDNGAPAALVAPTRGGDDLVVTSQTLSANAVVKPDFTHGRYLIIVENPGAPADYQFALGMSAGSHAVLDVAGAVDIVDSGGRVIQAVATPWAVDARGTTIPTRFTVRDTILTQHIAFTGTTVFPIVADPALSMLPTGQSVSSGKSGSSGKSKATKAAKAKAAPAKAKPKPTKAAAKQKPKPKATKPAVTDAQALAEAKTAAARAMAAKATKPTKAAPAKPKAAPAKPKAKPAKAKPKPTKPTVSDAQALAEAKTAAARAMAAKATKAAAKKPVKVLPPLLHPSKAQLFVSQLTAAKKPATTSVTRARTAAKVTPAAVQWNAAKLAALTKETAGSPAPVRTPTGNHAAKKPVKVLPPLLHPSKAQLFALQLTTPKKPATVSVTRARTAAKVTPVGSKAALAVVLPTPNGKPLPGSLFTTLAPHPTARASAKANQQAVYRAVAGRVAVIKGQRATPLGPVLPRVSGPPGTAWLVQSVQRYRQQQLTASVNATTRRLPRPVQKLITSVVTGQQALSAERARLTADQASVTRGRMSAAAYQAAVAAYKTTQRRVDAQTLQLAGQTGHLPRVVLNPHAPLSAGCGTNGVFAACAAATRPGTARSPTRQGCTALNGVSGCAVSAVTARAAVVARYTSTGTATSAAQVGWGRRAQLSTGQCPPGAARCTTTSNAVARPAIGHSNSRSGAGSVSSQVTVASANGRAHATGRASCGGVGCTATTVAAIDLRTGAAQAAAACHGTRCVYAATAAASATARARAGRAVATVIQHCGQAGSGQCGVGAAALASAQAHGRGSGVVVAAASGACSGSPAGNCRGSFTSRAALGTTRIATCTGTGSGGCSSLATLAQAGVTATGRVRAHVQAPGETHTATLPRGTATLPRGTLTARTHTPDSVGGFLHNLIHGAKGIVTGIPHLVTSLPGAAARSVSNFLKFQVADPAVTSLQYSASAGYGPVTAPYPMPVRRPGESQTAYDARIDPLFAPIVDGQVAVWRSVANGTITGRLYHDPVGTALQLTAIPSLLVGGEGGLADSLDTAATAARAADAAVATTSATTKVLSGAAGLTRIVQNPIRLLGLTGRVGALSAGKILPATATALDQVGASAGRLAAGDGIPAVVQTGLRTSTRGLGATSTALRSAAAVSTQLAGVTLRDTLRRLTTTRAGTLGDRTTAGEQAARGDAAAAAAVTGQPGLTATEQAYHRLGVAPDATPAQVDAAFQQQLSGLRTDLARGVRPIEVAARSRTLHDTYRSVMADQAGRHPAAVTDTAPDPGVGSGPGSGAAVPPGKPEEPAPAAPVGVETAPPPVPGGAQVGGGRLAGSSGGGSGAAGRLPTPERGAPQAVGGQVVDQAALAGPSGAGISEPARGPPDTTPQPRTARQAALEIAHAVAVKVVLMSALVLAPLAAAVGHLDGVGAAVDSGGTAIATASTADGAVVGDTALGNASIGTDIAMTGDQTGAITPRIDVADPAVLHAGLPDRAPIGGTAPGHAPIDSARPGSAAISSVPVSSVPVSSAPGSSVLVDRAGLGQPRVGSALVDATPGGATPGRAPVAVLRSAGNGPQDPTPSGGEAGMLLSADTRLVEPRRMRLPGMGVVTRARVAAQASMAFRQERAATVTALRFAPRGFTPADAARLSSHELAQGAQRAAAQIRARAVVSAIRIRDGLRDPAAQAQLTHARQMQARAEAVARRLRGWDMAVTRARLGRVLADPAVSEAVRSGLEGVLDRGGLTAGEINRLVTIGAMRGHARPAQALGEFAAEHRLGWTRGEKRGLLTALRVQAAQQVPDRALIEALAALNPVPAPHPRAAGGSHEAGGPSLISHGAVSPAQALGLEHLTGRRPIVEQLPSTDAWLNRWSGHTAKEFTDFRARGLRAQAGLITGAAALGVSGLVIWASRDGWLYTDTRTLAALRAGALDAPGRRALFAHELLHTLMPTMPEGHAQDAAPLPDLSPLAHLHPAAAPSPVLAFGQVADVYGRPAWQAPELGATPPAVLHRVARMVVPRTAEHRRTGSGLIWSSEGGWAHVLTNRHVVAGVGALWVEVSTPAGVLAVRGDVAGRPSPTSIARWLGSQGHDHGLTAAQLLQAAEELDLALVRIRYRSTVAPVQLDGRGLDHRTSLLGFPGRQLPVRGAGGAVESLRTRGEHLVVSAGVTAAAPHPVRSPVHRLSVLFNDPWVGHGNSGGPLLTATPDAPNAGTGSEELLRGLVSVGFARQAGGRRGAFGAVGAPAIEAYVRAAGLDTPSAARAMALAPVGLVLAGVVPAGALGVAWAAAGLGGLMLVTRIAGRLIASRPRAPPRGPTFAARLGRLVTAAALVTGLSLAVVAGLWGGSARAAVLGRPEPGLVTPRAAPVSSNAVAVGSVSGAGRGLRVRVQPGDTLSEYAAATGTTVREWLRANPDLVDPNLIDAGQLLRAPPGLRSWRVQTGDTLDAIAARFMIRGGGLALAKVDRRQLLTGSPNRIWPGQLFPIPAPARPRAPTRPQAPPPPPYRRQPPAGTAPTQPGPPPGSATALPHPSPAGPSRTHTGSPTARGPPADGWWRLVLQLGEAAFAVLGVVLGAQKLWQLRNRIRGVLAGVGRLVRSAALRMRAGRVGLGIVLDRARAGELRGLVVELGPRLVGRGWAGWRPGRGRTAGRLAAVTGAGIGLGTAARLAESLVGLRGFGVSAGGVLVGVLAAGAVTGASAVVGVRAWWPDGLPRGPPRTGWPGSRATRVARVAGVAGLAAAGVAAGWFAPAVVAAAAGWVAGWRVGPLKTVLAALVVSAPFNLRFVLHRARVNRERRIRDEGPETAAQFEPRREAWWSASWAAAVNVVNNLLQLSTVPAFAVLYLRLGVLPAAAAAAVGSAVQRRLIGRERVWFAWIAAGYAIPTTLLLHHLMIGSVPHGWRSYGLALGGWELLAAPSSLLADYAVGRGGRVLLRLSSRPQQAVNREGLGAAVDPGRRSWPVMRRVQQRLDRWRTDFETFMHPDFRVSVLKLDPLFVTAYTYMIVRPLPGVPEHPALIAARIAAVGVLVAVTWRARNRLDRWAHAMGSSSGRAMARRVRPLAPWHRLPRRVRPWRRLLEQFLTTVDPDRYPQPDPGRVLDGSLAAELAALLGRVVTTEPPPAMTMTAVTAPVTAAQEKHRQEVAQMRAERHRQHLRALSWALILVASNRPALAAAAQRRARDPVTSPVLEFLLELGDQLRTPATVFPQDFLDGVGLGSEAASGFGPAGAVGWPVLRGVAQRALHAALVERHRLRVAELTERLRARQRDRGNIEVNGATPAQRREQLRQIRVADRTIVRVEGELARERVRVIDPRGLVGARALLRERRRSVADQLATEDAKRRGVARRLTTGRAVRADPVRLPGPAEVAALTKDVNDSWDRTRVYRRLDAAFALVEASVGILEEAELAKAWHRTWRRAIAHATAAAPQVPTGSPLAVLLTMADTRPADPPVTAAAQPVLRLLAGWGGLELDPALPGGYRVAPSFAAAWAGAHPRLQRAVRTAPLLLPGAAGVLDPLLRDPPVVAGGPDAVAARYAYTVLTELLHDGTRTVYERPEPGLANDLVRGWYRQTGRLDRRRHPAPRAAAPTAATAATPRAAIPSAAVVGADGGVAAATGRMPGQELTVAVRDLSSARRAVLAARLTEHAARRGLHTAGPNAPPQSSERPDEGTAVAGMAEALSAQDRAAERLRNLVHDVRTQVYSDPAARPARIGRLLDRAGRALTELDPPAAPAKVELRGAASALRSADRILARAARPHVPGDLRDAVYQAALWRAKIALRRFAAAQDRSREAGIDRQFWPRLLGAYGKRVAARLLKRDSTRLNLDAVRSEPELDGDHSTTTGRPAPGPDPIPFAVPGAAGVSERGVRGGANRHAAAMHRSPDGVVTAMLADGLSNTDHAPVAAAAAVDTALPEAVRTDRVVTETPVPVERTPFQALFDGAAAAAAAVVALAVPGRHANPATTLLAVRVTPARTGSRPMITIANLGDSSAYWLPTPQRGIRVRRRRGAPERLTDHPTGGLTAYLGRRPRTPPTEVSFRPARDGVLILATAALADHFPRRPDFADATIDGTQVDAYRHPQAAIEILLAHARRHGADGDLTAIAIPVSIDPPPSPEPDRPGGTGTPGGSRRERRSAPTPIRAAPSAPGRGRLDDGEIERLFRERIEPRVGAGARPAPQPVAILTAGPPGVGKTHLMPLLTGRLTEHGYAYVNADALRTVHPRWAELLERDERTAADRIQPDVAAWVERSIRHATARGVHVVLDSTLSRETATAGFLRQFRDHHYRIEVAVVAAPLAASWLGTLVRYQTDYEAKGYGRISPRTRYQDTAAQILTTVGHLVEQRAVDQISVYRGDPTRPDRTAILLERHTLDPTRREWSAPPGTISVLQAEHQRRWSSTETEAFLAALSDLSARMDPRWYPDLAHAVDLAGDRPATRAQRAALHALRRHLLSTHPTGGRRARRPGRRGSAREGGGLVAISPSGRAQRAMVGAAETLYRASTLLEPEQHPGGPRGPPVRVRLAPARLRPAGAEGVIAFAYRTRGVVLIFDDTFVEIGTHISAGRLPVSWWTRLLTHEHEFHLTGARHSGLRHTLDAAAIAARLVRARVSGRGTGTAAGTSRAGAVRIRAPPAGLPLVPLPTATYDGSLLPQKTTSRGGPAIIKLRLDSGRVVVAKHRDPRVLISSVSTAAAYGLIGVPSAGARLAIATAPVADDHGNVVIRAGDMLEVDDFVDGGAVDLDTAHTDLRNQLAGQFAVAMLFGDGDGTISVNLVVAGGVVHRVDFGHALRDRRAHPSFWRIAHRPMIFGRLTEADVLGQFRALTDQRDRLRAALPNPRLRRIVLRRLARMDRMIEAGRLTDRLAAHLETEQRVFADLFPGHRRPATGYPPPRPRGLPNTDAFAAIGVTRVVTGTRLRNLASQGQPIWVHTPVFGGRWRITTPSRGRDPSPPTGTVAPRPGPRGPPPSLPAGVGRHTAVLSRVRAAAAVLVGWRRPLPSSPSD